MKTAPLLVLALLAFRANAQKVIQDFSAQNVADDQTTSLTDFKASKGVVVLFTGNACAYDSYYNSRIKSLIEKYRGSIQFLLINSYVEVEESIENMKAKYQPMNLPVPYLADKDQKIMEAMGAKKSPEAFLLKSDGGKYLVIYSGAIDDNAQLAEAVKQSYLAEAIDRVLAGKPIEAPVMRVTGCSIRKK